MQELESEVRHTGKLLIDKDRAIAEGKISAHNLLEAQRQMSELEKRNNVLEKVKFCMMQMLMLSMQEERVAQHVVHAHMSVHACRSSRLAA
jgi:hypothetical protein